MTATIIREQQPLYKLESPVAPRVASRRNLGDAWIERGDALECVAGWPRPTAIISDGPYGVKGYPGDPPTVEPLAEAYEPHVSAWSAAATPETTLWFWNTELGWATVHPVLKAAGWEYRSCHVWDKGIAHAAGNSNGKTLRKFPVVTEVCVQYTRNAIFRTAAGDMNMQEWLRQEWERSGLPLCQTNAACGVKNAATRKYFTKDHLWYYPPPDAFERLTAYANEHGDPKGRPYFSINGKKPITIRQWRRMRAKFNFENGVTNVWHEPALRSEERVRNESGFIHTNQKPLKLMERCIAASTDPGDTVWEPFGGLCTGALAAVRLNRNAYAAEIDPDFHAAAVTRLGRVVR